MANKYFTQLTQLAAGSVASGDAIAIEDISAGETKYITSADYATYVSSTLAAASGGWDAVADTWAYLGTYSGGGTVSIPAGGTLLYGKGDKIKFVQGGTQQYFYAIEVGGTTLKITGGSDYTLGTAAITEVYYSKTENPLGFPNCFNYTVVHTGFSTAPTYIARFNLNSTWCSVAYTCTGLGPSNTNAYTITIPIPAATIANMIWYSPIPTLWDASVVQAGGLLSVTSAGTTATLYTASSGTWTPSGNKLAASIFSYEI